MAKGKRVFIELRCPQTGARIKTTTYNKTTHKTADIAAKLTVYSPKARVRVKPIVKEIKRTKVT